MKQADGNSRNERSALAVAIGAVVLTGCSHLSVGDRVAQTIQQDVIKQGGLSLKAVVCPQEAKPRANEVMECTGETDSGNTFTIPVKWKDDKGDFSWEIPNARGLLNLTKFEGLVQAAVKSEIGADSTIRCGTTVYRAVRPGERFICQMVVKSAPKPAARAETKDPSKDSPTDTPDNETAKEPPPPVKPDTIQVSVDADRNITWQRLLAGQSPKSAAAPTETAKASSTAPASSATATQPEVPKPEATAKPEAVETAPPPQKSAEDFLNQPGASNQFED